MIILAVRNPLDVCFSFLQMFGTQSHTRSFREDFTKDIVLRENYWNYWFDSEIKMWVQWHEYWLDIAGKTQIPIYMFRFEDLLLQPEGVLNDMFKFMRAQEELDGTVIE